MFTTTTRILFVFMFVRFVNCTSSLTLSKSAMVVAQQDLQGGTCIANCNGQQVLNYEQTICNGVIQYYCEGDNFRAEDYCLGNFTIKLERNLLHSACDGLFYVNYYGEGIKSFFQCGGSLKLQQPKTDSSSLGSSGPSNITCIGTEENRYTVPQYPSEQVPNNVQFMSDMYTFIFRQQVNEIGSLQGFICNDKCNDKQLESSTCNGIFEADCTNGTISYVFTCEGFFMAQLTNSFCIGKLLIVTNEQSVVVTSSCQELFVFRQEYEEGQRKVFQECHDSFISKSVQSNPQKLPA